MEDPGGEPHGPGRGGAAPFRWNNAGSQARVSGAERAQLALQRSGGSGRRRAGADLPRSEQPDARGARPLLGPRCATARRPGSAASVPAQARVCARSRGVARCATSSRPSAAWEAPVPADASSPRPACSPPSPPTSLSARQGRSEKTAAPGDNTLAGAMLLLGTACHAGLGLSTESPGRPAGDLCLARPRPVPAAARRDAVLFSVRKAPEPRAEQAVQTSLGVVSHAKVKFRRQSLSVCVFVCSPSRAHT